MAWSLAWTSVIRQVWVFHCSHLQHGAAFSRFKISSRLLLDLSLISSTQIIYCLIKWHLLSSSLWSIFRYPSPPCRYWTSEASWALTILFFFGNWSHFLSILSHRLSTCAKNVNLLGTLSSLVVLSTHFKLFKLSEWIRWHHIFSGWGSVL